MTLTQRLFIALEIPADLREVLAITLEKLRRAVPENTIRWTAPENLHLTLKFLGDVAIQDIPNIQNRLSYAVRDHKPFTIEIKSAGCFPNMKSPRIVWLGLPDPQDHLHALRDSVESYIAPLGYPTESRPFSPHLTLGRTKNGIPHSLLAQLGRAVQELKIDKVADWYCHAVSLIRSELKPTGAEYSRLNLSHLTEHA